MQKGFIQIVLLVLLLGVLSAGGYWVYQNQIKKDKGYIQDEYGMPIFIPSQPPQTNKPLPETKPDNGIDKGSEGNSCGGFGGEEGDRACPEGYKCGYEKPWIIDGPGKCQKI